MKFRFGLFILVGLTSLSLASSAKADTFIYEVTSSLTNLHVKFELASFEQDVSNQTTFDIATDVFGTVTNFAISGGTGGCTITGFNLSPGPCWVAKAAGTVISDFPTPSFNAPGTFTSADTTVTITDVSSVPEPSAWILLSLALAGTGLAARRGASAKQS